MTKPNGAALNWMESAFGLTLLDRIAGLSGGRILVAVAGPPGSGKSTLAAALRDKLADSVLVPMDGFHLDDRVLKSRRLISRKGALETFDAEGFAALVQRVSVPRSEVIFPIFDREREIAIAGAGVVEPRHRIAVIEGNYLLLDIAPWNQLHYDLTIRLDVPEDELHRRLTNRWRDLGKDSEAVDTHLQNDLSNARLIIERSMDADIVLSV